MHELSIAMSIVDLATREAAQHAGKALAIHMRLGILSGVVKESLLSAWELARRDTLLDDADLVIEEIAAVAFCPICQKEQKIESIQRFCCSNCGSLVHDIVRGRELEIVGLELEE